VSEFNGQVKIDFKDKSNIEGSIVRTVEIGAGYLTTSHCIAYLSYYNCKIYKI
jgi:hypothetical protein